MTWNNRVIKTTTKWGNTYQIHEVYYDDTGNPETCTTTGVSPMGESLEELEEECRRYARACQQPILNMEDFKNESDGD